MAGQWFPSYSFSGGWGVSVIPMGFILAAATDRLASSLKGDKRDLLQKAVHDVMIPSIDTNFQVGGRPQWEGYSPNTINSTAVRMLQDTGALRAAATDMEIWQFTDEAATARLPYGVKYGAAHQYGAPSVNLPQREFIAMQPEDAEKIEEIFGEWVADRAKRSGLI